MVSIIRDTMSFGVIVSVDPKEYEVEMQRQPNIRRFVGSAYSICALRCAEYVSGWVGENGMQGDIFYRFEDGCLHAGEASDLMSKIGEIPQLKVQYRYGGHSFLSKLDSLPFQAADLLVWEWQHAFVTATVDGRHERRWRTNLKSLVDKPHKAERLSNVGISIKAMANSFYGLTGG